MTQNSRKRKLDDVNQEYPSSKRAKTDNHNINTNSNNSNEDILPLDASEQKYHHTNTLNHESIVELQVGEKKFITKIKTLTQNDNQNYFAKLFNGKFATNATYNKSYFIDRNGDIFTYILEYLRSNTLILSDKNQEIIYQKILIEAQFYMISSLIKFIKQKLEKPNKGLTLDIEYFPESEILSKIEQKQMQEFCLHLLKVNTLWELDHTVCGSKDIIQATYSATHNINQPTVILIEDFTGNVFGIKSNLGICNLSDLYPDIKKIGERQHFIYFSLRDSKQNISPFTVLAEGNQIMCGFIRNSEIEMNLRCSMKQIRKEVTILDIPISPQRASLRLVSLGNPLDYFTDNNKYVQFAIRRMEVFTHWCEE